jgi:hypothetical protein
LDQGVVIICNTFNYSIIEFNVVANAHICSWIKKWKKRRNIKFGIYILFVGEFHQLYYSWVLTTNPLPMFNQVEKKNGWGNGKLISFLGCLGSKASIGGNCGWFLWENEHDEVSSLYTNW